MSVIVDDFEEDEDESRGVECIADSREKQSRMLRYRFDHKPVGDTVAVFGDNFISFRDDQQWKKPIIEGLRSADRLAIDGNTVGGGKVQLLFNVSGANDAMQRVRKDCQG